MGKGIKASNGHHSVPVVTLQHNPKIRTSDDPSVGKARGGTLLPTDRGKSPKGQ
jgi:hypothetical protein